ncbi:PTS fructose transporter subunit IIA, partial [Stenotrophomonas maltophilia]
MPLTDLLAAVQTQLCTATDRDSVLQAAAGLLACRQANAEQIYLNLCQREALGITAIGHGIAIPHAARQPWTAP